MKLKSTITCPECGTSREETMPTDRCLVTYTCTSCGAVIKPEKGDCCVFCSYGTNPCPSMQDEYVNTTTVILGN
jgi:rubredoxin